MKAQMARRRSSGAGAAVVVGGASRCMGGRIPEWPLLGIRLRRLMKERSSSSSALAICSMARSFSTGAAQLQLAPPRHHGPGHCMVSVVVVVVSGPTMLGCTSRASYTRQTRTPCRPPYDSAGTRRLWVWSALRRGGGRGWSLKLDLGQVEEGGIDGEVAIALTHLLWGDYLVLEILLVLSALELLFVESL